jgi:Tol biopolymer transport system component
MTTTTCRLGAALAALTICLAAWSGGDHKQAGIAARHPSERSTFLLSSANGGLPNGPSRNAAVSHDQRIARYMAYESDASNIVAGDTNGKTDVFLVSRAQPYGQNGTPWKPAGTKLISRGKGGRPANGASYAPALDGDSHHAPHCLAFVSAASNLVRGDTNGKPDGFVYNTRTQRIRRVTVGSAGAQANGSTYGISISGDCERVAFTSDATNIARARASKAGTAASPGTRQVYVRVLRGYGPNASFKGLTLLASAANNGAAGNGDSQDASIARSGKAVVFASTATNLSKGDGTGTSDVYRRTINRRYVQGVQTLQGSLGLVSASASGTAGNGASTHPAVTDDGRYVAFATDASNILAGDTNGVSDIARADMRTGKPNTQWVSKTPIGGIGNGASHDPVISDAGQFVLFDSDATNLRPSHAVKTDRNGVKDVFLWNERTHNVSLESRDASNGYLSSPSQHPATSSHGNYVAFESGSSLAGMPMPTLPQLPNMNIPQMPGLPQMPRPGLNQVTKPGMPQLPKLPGLPQVPGMPQLPKPGLPGVQMPKLPGFGKARRSASINRISGPAASGSEQVYLRYLGPK